MTKESDPCREVVSEFRDLVYNTLGENIHTAFRKGSDHPSADRVWRVIQQMPDEEWARVLDWMKWAWDYSSGWKP